ncbi:MAG: hypothetical protein PHY80_02625 [Rickettsiales bacterium]|nr:hypothetical protein [Rickettsiales bacterium]
MLNTNVKNENIEISNLNEQLFDSENKSNQLLDILSNVVGGCSGDWYFAVKKLKDFDLQADDVNVEDVKDPNDFIYFTYRQIVNNIKEELLNRLNDLKNEIEIEAIKIEEIENKIENLDDVVEYDVNSMASHLWVLHECIFNKEDVETFQNEISANGFEMLLTA